MARYELHYITDSCKFCREHCKEDTIYTMYYNDAGYIFEPIRDIKFCPLCGKELPND